MSPVPPERLVPGAVIDGFVIGERLHPGGMGSLFRVTHPEHPERPLLMKVPRVGPSEPVEGILSFETEVTLLPALTGPHVPRFVAAGDLARLPYLVLEYVEGRSLEELLQAGPLAAPEVARLGAAIADAVHSLHSQDAIHLDLKPSNIVVREDGTAVLIDLGFAHHAAFPDLLAEETRHRAGSAPYLSPEQLLGSREDARSDVFALGVVLYEMATGALPFGEPDTDPRNRLWLDPVPPVQHAPATPPWLQEVILRCIDPRAARRYQSAAHVAFDLRNPEQVVLTARATRSKRAGLLRQLRRFWRAYGEHARTLRSPQVQVSRYPIVMIAVDTTHLDDERQPAIRRAAAQILSLSSEFRVVCVSVIGSQPLIEGPTRAESASGLHLEHLVRLRHWTESLKVPAQRLSLHALESSNPAEALLDFARLNNVDLIVLGAPGPTQPERSWWDSTASKVTARAHCSVHVVRVPAKREPRP